MALSWLSLGAVRASASSRAAALQSPPIEALASHQDAATWIAGGKQTKGALPLKTALFDGALYSSRGRGYARYNEDAAILFSDRAGRAYAAVFDQAGGLGGRVRGQASELAARHAFEAFRAIALLEDPSPAEQRALIVDAVEKAHVELIGRGEGEVTTAVIAIAGRGSMVLVNSGDSGAIQFDAQGKTKAMTAAHEHDSPLAVGCLTHALGLVPETAAPDGYAWVLEKGDWVLMCSDGLLDSGLTDRDIGLALSESESAEAGVNKLCARVLRSMTMLRAKPDNLTVLAIRAL